MDRRTALKVLGSALTVPVIGVPEAEAAELPPFEGEIDDVRVFDRMLTDEEVVSFHQQLPVKDLEIPQSLRDKRDLYARHYIKDVRIAVDIREDSFETAFCTVQFAPGVLRLPGDPRPPVPFEIPKNIHFQMGAALHAIHEQMRLQDLRSCGGKATMAVYGLDEGHLLDIPDCEDLHKELVDMVTRENDRVRGLFKVELCFPVVPAELA